MALGGGGGCSWGRGGGFWGRARGGGGSWEGGGSWVGAFFLLGKGYYVCSDDQCRRGVVEIDVRRGDEGIQNMCRTPAKVRLRPLGHHIRDGLEDVLTVNGHVNFRFGSTFPIPIPNSNTYATYGFGSPFSIPIPQSTTYATYGFVALFTFPSQK